MGISDFINYIVPPEDPKLVKRWRWAIFIVVLLLIVNAASSRGLLGGYGAHAAAQDVKSILALQLAESSRYYHDQFCQAQTNEEPTDRLAQTLEEYQLQYKDVTGDRYPTGSCSKNS